MFSFLYYKVKKIASGVNRLKLFEVVGNVHLPIVAISNRTTPKLHLPVITK